MTLRGRGLRAVTWLAEATGNLTEVHVLSSTRWILTMWNGDIAALDLARQRFAESGSELEKSPYLAAAILLQFLLATLDETISAMDARLYEMEEQLEKDPESLALAELRKRLSRRKPTWARLERYSSSVQLAIVGVEAVPGVDARAAAELNDYGDQVEDVERRFHERIECRSPADWCLRQWAGVCSTRKGPKPSWSSRIWPRRASARCNKRLSILSRFL